MPLISLDDVVEKYDIPGLKEDLNKLDTGDILLYGGTEFWFSKLIRFWTKSDWTHISIILRDPTYIDPALTGLYIWESGIENFRDAENKQSKLGVQINDLEEVLKNYNGFICYRKLHADIPDFKEKLKMIHETVHDAPYDTNIVDLLETTDKVEKVETKYKPYHSRIMNWLMPRHKRTDTYFCSALVGCIYTRLELLPPQTRWTECQPGFFSSQENPNMKLEGSARLETDKLLYLSPHCRIQPK